MNEKLIVNVSPHIASPRTTRGIMLDVIIALMAPAVASVVFFGLRAAIRICVCIVACVLSEWLYCKLMKKPNPIGDFSAIITGMLLAFNVPPGLPIWQAVLGSVFAIVVVKQLFGGMGCNFVNPALAARVVLAISFTSSMSLFARPFLGVDAVSTATPMGMIRAGSESLPDLLTLFLGQHAGVLGETSALAILIGGIYLCIRKVIKPIIPVAYIGSALLFLWLFGCANPVASILSGGLFLGAVFMATDYVTSPYTNWGKVVFGIGCGLLTALIRTFANSMEGVSYSILIMNLLVPYINDLTRSKPLGTGGAKIA